MGDTMSGGLVLGGATSGSIELKAPAVAGSNTLTLPAATGTVITSADTGSVTNGMLAGSISNDKLANSTITIGGQSVALGGSIAGIGNGSTGALFDVVRLIDQDRTIVNGLNKVTNLTVRIDTNNSFSTGLSRLTPNVAGYYFINARFLSTGAFTGGSVSISLYKNGTDILNSGTTANFGTSFLDFRGYVLVNGSTDYLELYLNVSLPSNLIFTWPRIQWSGHMVRAA